MTEQLREALRDLAEGAPEIDATAATSGRTWRQARQARRRAMVAMSLAVVAILVGGIMVAVALSGTSRSAPATPAPYVESDLAIPNRLWIPSPWTPGTDGAGPLGPLALIATAPHRDSWFHIEDQALFGVSAVDGTYRFIDVPNIDNDPWGGSQRFALSPDGTKIAYWLQGSAGPKEHPSADAGVGVYDTVTGKVVTHATEARYGVAGNWLAWSADSQHVAFDYSPFRATSLHGDVASPSSTVVWEPQTNGLRDVGEIDSFGPPPSAWKEGVALVAGRRTLLLLDPATGQTHEVHLGVQIATPGAESPDGQLIAFGGAPNRCCNVNDSGGTASGAVYVAHRPSAEQQIWSATKISTDTQPTEVVGWSDNAHVLVARPGYSSPFRIVSIDVNDGQTTTVLSAPGDSDPAPRIRSTFWPSVARALIDRPFVGGARPAAIRDPRLIPGLIGGLTAGILVVGAVTWLRRRPSQRRIPGDGGVR